MEFTAPIDDRYLEDYQVGGVYEYGPITVRAEETLDFARRYDPQPIHTDPVAAQRSPYGGLIASGWHTTALMMRLLADHYLSRAASLGSPGVDELRWPAPVRAGDDLWLRATVIEARRSRSKPDRGVVRTGVELFNQRDEIVLSMVVVNLLTIRPAVQAQAVQAQAGGV
jgi:acyl dehydratase